MITIDHIQVHKTIFYKGEKLFITEIVKSINNKTSKLIIFKCKTDSKGLVSSIIHLIPFKQTFAANDIRWTTTLEEYERMVSFANIHVNKALQSAYSKSEMIQSDEHNDNDTCIMFTEYGERYILDRESILGAYPLENIK